MKTIFVKYEGNNSSRYDGKVYETDTRLVASLNGEPVDVDPEATSLGIEFSPGDRVSIKHGKSKSSKTWLGFVVDPIGQVNIINPKDPSGQYSISVRSYVPT